MLRRFTAILLAALLLCPLSATAAAGGRYSDVPSDHWSVADIEKATQYGLISGLPDGTFGFGRQMDRASFVTVLCHMFSWAKAAPSAPAYTDTASNWAYGWIEAALAHGALEPGGAFRPEEFITREEMAVILVRALDYDQLARSLKDTPLPFPDVSENKGYIALAYRFGIISGVPQTDGTLHFVPHDSATRETAAAMLVRTYERYTAKIDWLHGFYAFDSYPQIGLTAKMDAVSVGWARLDVDAAGTPFLNRTTQNGNEWNVPQGASLATDTFAANGTACNLNVFADGDDLAAILASEQSRALSAAAIAAAVGPYSGITIDFEGLRADKKADFTAFMTALRAALPADESLWVAVQPPTSTGGTPGFDGFDFKALGAICDKVILMAHDYKPAALSAASIGSANVGTPVTPFPDIYRALAAITDADTGVADKGKIALALAIDSSGYEVDAKGQLAATALYSPGVATLTKRLQQPEAVRGWSDTYRNSYITYTGDEGKTYRVWYEDARGVTEKIKLAAMFGVTGVSLWRVGNLPNVSDPALDYDVWGAILARR